VDKIGQEESLTSIRIEVAELRGRVEELSKFVMHKDIPGHAPGGLASPTFGAAVPSFATTESIAAQMAEEGNKEEDLLSKEFLSSVYLIKDNPNG